MKVHLVTGFSNKPTTIRTFSYLFPIMLLPVGSVVIVNIRRVTATRHLAENAVLQMTLIMFFVVMFCLESSVTIMNRAYKRTLVTMSFHMGT